MKLLIVALVTLAGCAAQPEQALPQASPSPDALASPNADTQPLTEAPPPAFSQEPTASPEKPKDLSQSDLDRQAVEALRQSISRSTAQNVQSRLNSRDTSFDPGALIALREILKVGIQTFELNTYLRLSQGLLERAGPKSLGDFPWIFFDHLVAHAKQEPQDDDEIHDWLNRRLGTAARQNLVAAVVQRNLFELRSASRTQTAIKLAFARLYKSYAWNLEPNEKAILDVVKFLGSEEGETFVLEHSEREGDLFQFVNIAQLRARPILGLLRDLYFKKKEKAYSPGIHLSQIAYLMSEIDPEGPETLEVICADQDFPKARFRAEAMLQVLRTEPTYSAKVRATVLRSALALANEKFHLFNEKNYSRLIYHAEQWLHANSQNPDFAIAQGWIRILFKLAFDHRENTLIERHALAALKNIRSGSIAIAVLELSRFVDSAHSQHFVLNATIELCKVIDAYSNAVSLESQQLELLRTTLTLISKLEKWGEDTTTPANLIRSQLKTGLFTRDMLMKFQDSHPDEKVRTLLVKILAR